MKKLFTIALILLTFSGFSQIGTVPIHSDTLINGSKFCYTYRGDLTVQTADSINAQGQNVPGYISLVNSTAEMKIKRDRVVNGDTITKYELITVPLTALSGRYNTFITSPIFKSKYKQAIKDQSLRRRLNQE